MNKINENDKMNFLYDLKSKENMHLYYAFKGRFDYTIEDKDQKMKLIQDSIKDFINKYDFIVYPESSSKFIEEVDLPKGKGLLIDDSYFSGTTYRGLIEKTGEMDFLAIFAK